MELITKKQIKQIMDFSHSGIPDISASIKEKLQYKPCNNCEDRKKFLTRMFLGDKNNGKKV